MRLLCLLVEVGLPGQAHVVGGEDDEGVRLDREPLTDRHLLTRPLVLLERVALRVLAGVVDKGQRADGGRVDSDELALVLPLLQLLEADGLVGDRQVERVLLLIGRCLDGDAELLLLAPAVGGRGVGDPGGGGVGHHQMARSGVRHVRRSFHTMVVSAHPTGVQYSDVRSLSLRRSGAPRLGRSY